MSITLAINTLYGALQTVKLGQQPGNKIPVYLWFRRGGRFIRDILAEPAWYCYYKYFGQLYGGKKDNHDM